MPVSLETMTLYQEGVTEALEDCGVYLSRELELDTPIRNWEGRFVPTNKALKMLRSSTGLLDILQKAINMKKISDVQGVTLKRMLDIIDLLHSFNKEDTGGDGESGVEDTGVEDIFINSDEENLFGELTIMEESELLAISPVVKSILEFKKLTKQEGMDLRKFINPVTGNIHPKYDQLGAATSRCCIAAGMKVLVKNTRCRVTGIEVPIELVQVGSLVYCLDYENNLVTRRVLDRWFKGEKETVEVVWEELEPFPHSSKTSSIVCTPDHLFKTKDNTWVEANNLKDQLVWSYGKSVWHKIIKVTSAGLRKVYDLEVEDYNNFFCQELCVHNSSSRPNSQQIGNKQHATLTFAKPWFAPIGVDLKL